MSTNLQNQTSKIDLLLKILEAANATGPVAISAVASVIGIIKSGRMAGKTDAEIEAEAADSMATALRTRAKSEEQMGNQP